MLMFGFAFWMGLFFAIVILMNLFHFIGWCADKWDQYQWRRKCKKPTP